MTASNAIIETKSLKSYYQHNNRLTDTLLRREREYVQAVDGVSLSLDENETKGIIGESGCGKSTLLKTLMGLKEPTAGTIEYKGDDVSQFDRKDWKNYRRNVQMIFQNPFSSLDPKLTVSETLSEPLKIHGLDNRTGRIHDTLESVELKPVQQYLNKLPGELSGGEKQRVSIARALIVEPSVILADEPVSMLDVSTQASLLQLLSKLTNEFGISMLYISHDLSTVSHVCSEINVMYLGRIVESAPTNRILSEPKHPYSEALMNAIPIPDPFHERDRTELEGVPPDPVNMGDGCRFRDRCPERMDVCELTPRKIESEPDHFVACHLYYDDERSTAEGSDGGRKLAGESSH